MSRNGRPPLSTDALCQRLDDSSPQARTRTRLILQTLSGERDVASVAQELGLSDERFRQLRDQAIAGMASALEPRRPGRQAPPQPSPEDKRIAELEAFTKELQLELACANVREELSLLMPHLLEPKPNIKKKRRSPPR